MLVGGELGSSVGVDESKSVGSVEGRDDVVVGDATGVKVGSSVALVGSCVASLGRAEGGLDGLAEAMLGAALGPPNMFVCESGDWLGLSVGLGMKMLCVGCEDSCLLGEALGSKVDGVELGFGLSVGLDPKMLFVGCEVSRLLGEAVGSTMDGVELGFIVGEALGLFEGFEVSISVGISRDSDGILEGCWLGDDEGLFEGAKEVGNAEGNGDIWLLGDAEGIRDGSFVGPSLRCNEGREDGLEEGLRDGSFVGPSLGCNEGLEEGLGEGFRDGCLVGPSLGCQEGLEDGLEEGFRDGSFVGPSLCNEGLEEGLEEGFRDGCFVGLIVGWIDGSALASWLDGGELGGVED